MKKEVSAGGVIFKKKANKLMILLLKDAKSEWTFPKGLIEEGENNIATALREIEEEVGLHQVRYIVTICKVNYKYTWRGNLVDKTVHYYLFEATGDETPYPQKEEGIQEAKWFAYDEALMMIGYKKTNEPVLQKVKELISSRQDPKKKSFKKSIYPSYCILQLFRKKNVVKSV
ncbi:NUDIX domain-containing protein [Candidatus Gottesmanbacteria bacterium]|nr:NUDIX domain-containing protein [Candidatus Gottesmanbacteria bacterium]